MPLLSSIVELIITKMVFLKQDAKYSLLIGLIYIPINYLGGKYEHTPVYFQIPYLNWSKPWETFGIFFTQAILMPIFVFIAALITQHLH